MKSRDEKLKLYLEKIKPLFPEIDVASVWSLYSGEYPVQGEIEFSETSTALKNKLVGKKVKHVIHYTTTEGLVGMIQDKAIRMSNLQSLNDPNELSFALNNLTASISKDEIEEFKRQTFVFSASDYNFKKPVENFDSWYRYAKKGEGFGLVFEIENQNDSWQEVYLGKVGYGIKNNNHRLLESFWSIHNDFENEHQLFQNKPLLLFALCSFVKDAAWKNEKEVRFTAFSPYNKRNYQPKHHQRGSTFLKYAMKFLLSQSNKINPYVYLPININQIRKDYQESFKDEAQVQSYLSTIPHLKLKRVIAGFAIKEKDFFEISDYIEHIATKSLGYPIEYGYSALTKNFNIHKNNSLRN